MERRYLKLLQDIHINGVDKGDRTGTGTRSLFGYQMAHDLSKGFPLLTTKKLFWKAIVHELLWFIAGDTNAGYLIENGVHIWNEWTPAYKKGGIPAVQRAFDADPRHIDLELGRAYGAQWRSFGKRSDFEGVDQLKNVIERIKIKPDCRRLIVSAWNPDEIEDVALPPCHTLFQFYVANGKLSLQLYQRSADAFLGVPFNIASYALLTHLVAHECGLKVGRFVHTFGDVHVYNNHKEQVAEQLQRTPFPMPEIRLNPKVKSVFDFTAEDIELIGYQSHPSIKAPVAV